MAFKLEESLTGEDLSNRETNGGTVITPEGRCKSNPNPILFRTRDATSPRAVGSGARCEMMRLRSLATQLKSSIISLG